MKRTFARLFGLGLLAFVSPLTLQAQTTTTTTTPTTQGGGGGSTAATQGTAQGVPAVQSLTAKTNITSATSGAGSATSIPSNSNFMVNTYVIPQSLGLPSLYANQMGAQNVISTSGGPKGKMTFLYVPAPSAATAAKTTAATTNGFSTYGTPRAPVYSTVLSQDLPLVKHDTGVLNSNIRATLDRSSMLRDKSGIQVRVEGNLVMLSGTIGSEREYRLAEGLVRTTPGVYEVRNEMTIVNSKN